jgi:hypothetical protein
MNYQGFVFIFILTEKGKFNTAVDVDIKWDKILLFLI